MFNHKFDVHTLINAAVGYVMPEYQWSIPGLHGAAVSPEVMIVSATGDAQLYVPTIAVRLTHLGKEHDEGFAAGDLCATQETAERIARAAAIVAAGGLGIAVVTDGPEDVSRRYRAAGYDTAGRALLLSALVAARNAVEVDTFYTCMPFDEDLDPDMHDDSPAIPLRFNGTALSYGFTGQRHV
ncbi:hypothetical protein [Burkholderia pseudomallei]|uniref:hypothetical protein n=1 Tax=Burkholderia pseudomallei TaxID=28450 RepID=UPI0022EACB26|nr:hypothetical protein [Burkholderia pseudomallei]